MKSASKLGVAQTTPGRAKSRNASAFSPHVEPHNDGIVNDPEINAEASDLAVDRVSEAASVIAVDTWLIRGILETTKVDGRVLRGRRLFSVLAIFEAKVTADLVSGLGMGPSEASKVARCAAADWNAPDDWKRKVVEAIERSANVSRVFLLVARVDEGWVTIPSYGNKNGSPRFEPMSKYEKWLARPLAVLPASDLLSFVYEKCEQIRRGSDNPRSRKKP
jgi:hypothetical protein